MKDWTQLISAALLLTFAFLTQVQSQGDTNNYCQISPQHTACRFQGVGEKCGSLLGQGLNANEIKTVVELHNKLRSGLANGQEGRGSPGPQPPAANMLEMVWDEELAAVAQTWANQCDFAHDVNRDVTRFRVGQNLYETTRSHDQRLEMTINEGVMGWYDEVKDVDRTIANRYKFDFMTGHYTQMVWASTDRIGCGHTSYKSGNWIKKLLVCNYGPTGNFIGSPMYEVGNPCSKCLSGTSCSLQYPGLCTSNTDLNDIGNNEIFSPSMPTLNGFFPIQDIRGPTLGNVQPDNTIDSTPVKVMSGDDFDNTLNGASNQPNFMFNNSAHNRPPQFLLPPTQFQPIASKPIRFGTPRPNRPRMPNFMQMLGNIFRMPRMFG